MQSIINFSENIGKQFDIKDKFDISNTIVLGEFNCYNNILGDYHLFKVFYIQKSNAKIYVIIDEYDHFANELLGFKTEEFKNLVSKNGKIRK
ncbi:MAG: hypothetical protein ACI33S_04010, partial [Bacilli bacterium]